MPKKTTITDTLHKLVEEAQADGHQRREAQAEAQAAQAEVARCRDVTVEAHANGGDQVATAMKAYHAAERTLAEAKIKAEGLGRKAERSRAAIVQFERENNADLLADLEPDTTKLMAEELELVARLVAIEDKKAAIRNRASQLVTAAGHNPQGNVPAPDVLDELAPVLRDVASGLRPLTSPMPNWKHRDATAPPGRAGGAPSRGPHPARHGCHLDADAGRFAAGDPEDG
jgi:hypothetical protein